MQVIKEYVSQIAMAASSCGKADCFRARGQSGKKDDSLRKDGSYEIYIGTTTVGIAMYTGVMSYAVDSSVSILPAKFGTCQDEAYMAEYVKMINSNNYDAYIKSFMRMQEMNAEIVPVIALSISPVYAPYRTDKIGGWINYPSWGVINTTTWYTVSMK